MDDYFSIGNQIVDRLKTITGVPVSFVSAVDEQYEDKMKRTELFVIPGGNEDPADSTYDAKVYCVSQQWLVVIATTDPIQAKGQLVSLIIGSLAGYKFNGAKRPIRWVQTEQKPDRSPGGVNYYPLCFNCQFLFNVRLDDENQ